MKKLILLILIFIPAFSFATTIVIVIHNNVIYIGADGKVTNEAFYTKNGIKIDTEIYSKTCKISKSGIFFCTGDGYDAGDIIKFSNQILNKAIDFESIENTLKHQIIFKFNKMIERIRKSDRGLYIKFFKKEYFAAIAFCYFKKE
jgi:hypothetical protein